MLNSLTTTAQVSDLTAQIATIYDYVSTNVEPYLVTTGTAVPTVEQQARPWVKIHADGSLDAVFTYHNSNWHTRMPHQIGTIAFFPASEPFEIGWEAVDGNLGLSITSGYQLRRFTGSALIIIDHYAYRRFDQALVTT